MKRQELVDWEDRGEHLAPGLSDGQMSAGRSGKEAPDSALALTPGLFPQTSRFGVRQVVTPTIGSGHTE